MINLLIGPPGGGKSYEAVVYHILPALAKGRLVITNLPLDLERLRQIDESYPALIKMVGNRKGMVAAKAGGWGRPAVAAEEEGIIRAFSTMADYADPWRHEVTGSGPLYVIDECHLGLPRGGTLLEVEEWYSLHRHESADVLLITQSYGKVSKSIVDLVQVCYRVKKGTAFGLSKNYIRKVQDGVRGDVVNTAVRKYEKRYFGLYKSHTRGGGSELEADDIVPIWKRWPFIGAAVMITLACTIFFAGGAPNILKPNIPQAKAEPSRLAAGLPGQKSDIRAPVAEKEPEPTGHPYAGRTLHLAGVLRGRGGVFYSFVVAQNGQKVSEVSGVDLERLGYKIKEGADCAAQVSFDKWSNWVICDAPQVGVAPSGKEGVQAGSKQG